MMRDISGRSSGGQERRPRCRQNAPGRHVLRHDAIRSDHRAVPDGDRTNQLCPGSDPNLVADRRRPLVASAVLSPDRDSLMEIAVLADPGERMDDNTTGMRWQIQP